MKNLVILLVILGVIWYWRSQKAKRPPTAPPDAPRKADSVAMGACAYCKLHVPDSELVQGQRGAYCSAEHLRLAENG